MKRIIALALILLLWAAAPAAAEAAPPAKEEVVYAHLDSSGKVGRIYVVNAFPDADGQIVDRGGYQQVTNLTNTDPIQMNNGRISVDTEPGSFYYQGELTSTEMPWLISFSYRLDDKPLTAAELMGASGALVMDVRVRANPKVDPVFFDNYMLQISINLDTQYFSEITATNAVIAANGEQKVVNLTALPGKEADFQIEAQAENAHLGQIQIAGLPYEMFVELPDVSSYLGELVKLQDAIAQLAAGVGQFTSGVGELSTASGQLGSGANALAGGAAGIAAGFDRLAAGRGDFDAGLRQYNQGVQAFAQGLSGLSGGIEQFNSGIGQLAEGSGRLAGGTSEYAAGMGLFSAGLGEASDGSGELVAGVAELSDGLAQLTEQGKYADPSLVSGSAQILAAFEMMDTALSLPLSDEEAALLLSLLQDFSAAFDQFAATVDATDFDTLLATLRGSLARFDTTVGSIEQIATNLQDQAAITAQLGIDVTDNPEAQALLAYMAAQGAQLASDSAELRATRDALAGLDPLIVALLDSLSTLQSEFATVQGLIARMNTAIQSITPDQIGELTDGLKLLSSNYRTFHAGLVAYVDGVEQAYLGVSGDPGVLSGVQELSDGLATLDANGEQLATGATELASGAGQLHQGILDLQTGVGQFGEQAGQIVAGADLLANGGNGIVSGHQQLMNGDAQFGQGLHDYASGMADYRDGVWQFSQGLGQLNTGGAELSAGADELRAGTATMDQQMSSMIDDAMADYLPRDYDLVSFTSPHNSGIKLVQFVYLVDAQTEPAPVDDGADQAPTKSWWQRILDIFR